MIMPGVHKDMQATLQGRAPEALPFDEQLGTTECVALVSPVMTATRRVLGRHIVDGLGRGPGARASSGANYVILPSNQFDESAHFQEGTKMKRVSLVLLLSSIALTLTIEGVRLLTHLLSKLVA